MCWGKRKLSILPLLLSARLTPSGYIYLSNQLHTTRLIEKYSENNKRGSGISKVYKTCWVNVGQVWARCVCMRVCVFEPGCRRLTVYCLWKHTGLYKIMGGCLRSWQCTRLSEMTRVTQTNTPFLSTINIKLLLDSNLPSKKRKPAGQTDVGERSEAVTEWFRRWMDPAAICLCDAE